MLRVTIEVVPWGIESRARKVGEVEITNLTGGGEFADYEVRVFTVEGFTRQLVFSHVVQSVIRRGGTYVSTAVNCLSAAYMLMLERFGKSETMRKLHWPLQQCGDESEGEGEGKTSSC